MDFGLSEEQTMIRTQVRQIADSFDLEYAAARDDIIELLKELESQQMVVAGA